MERKNIKELISQMTLEEKASLCSGLDFWHTKGVERLGVPSEIYVSTEMAGALVHGVQSRHVGTSPKHFMANNQEYHRMTSSSEMDERTMREIYLASFEGMVKKEKPWTIMNSYNKLNGTYLCENKEILTDILRKEWGFDGYVMTDWGAMDDRIEALKAGCNLEMPSCGGVTDAEIVAAVQEGTLDEAVLDQRCEEFLNIILQYEENRDKDAVFQYERDHEIARQIEEECIVLLKNEGEILPLSPDKNAHRAMMIRKTR